MDKEEILLKEYESLRAEILNAMANRNTILTFGLATIGILFTGAVSLTPSNLPVIILMIVVPLVCAYISMIWVGEYKRMQRAGAFIVGIEKKINEMAGDELLTWETFLRKNNDRHRKFPYYSTIIFLVLTGMISYFVGLYISKNTMPIFFSIIGIIIAIAFLLYLVLELKRCIKMTI
jgi:fatty acid desaturase